MRKPVAVCISDVHYSLKTLSLADAAMRQAIDKAASLHCLPVVVAGDLHDTKANMRGECVKVMIDTFKYGLDKGVKFSVLVGNHDLINEKGTENSLEFLRPYVNLITTPVGYSDVDFGKTCFIPYQHDAKEFERILSTIPKGTAVICHQGVTDADSGEYSFDKSAVDKSILADYRVISGHYHKAQDIKCGPPRKGAVGLMSYIGTPYTVSFAEANDGPKGFQILYDDGLLEHVPTNLRRHVVVQIRANETRYKHSTEVKPGDLLWVKVIGSTLDLDKVSKEDIKYALSLDNCNFKFDTIPTDTHKLTQEHLEKKTNWEIVDYQIEASQESTDTQNELKALARKVMS